MIGGMLQNSLLYHVQKFKFFHPLLLSASEKYSSYFGKWKLPDGHDTGITVYNAAVNKKVPLILKRKGIATWYMCGPTVYADSHIGHASCYVKFDIIRRVMVNIFDINVLLLMGVTDIDDKIIKKANQMKKPTFQVAKQYELDFFEDMKALRVLPPTLTSNVTDCINLVVSFCQKLIEKNYAYVTEKGDVYFMVNKGVSSGVLSELQVDCQTMIDPLKKDQRDFALWKAAKPGEPYWCSPWGEGRPGWHIECSAMASQMFGSSIDIHSGGYDLLFPHHTNELSQSAAYHGCPQWVNYWLHAGLLQLTDDAKMSKSLGNTITIKEFLKENSVNDFRILCLQSLYRNNIMFNEETLSGAHALHKKIHSFINEAELFISGELGNISFDENELWLKLSSTRQEITSVLSNDFNTSQTLLCLTELIDEVNKCMQILPNTVENNSEEVIVVSACLNYVDSLLENFGILVMRRKRLPVKLTCVVNAAAEFRSKVRLLALFCVKADFDEKCTHTEYVADAFKTFNQRIDISLPQDISKQCFDITNATELLHNQTMNFLHSHSLQNVQLIKQEVSKEKKKMMAPIFLFCDDFRTTLQHLGIGIKDQTNSSSWIPLIHLEKFI